MFVKSDIRKITIAVEKDLRTEVYLALGRAGIVHLTGLEERNSSADSGLQDEEALTKDILSGAEYALKALSMEPEEASIPSRVLSARADMKFISETKEIIERVVRLRTRIREVSEAVDRCIEYADALARMGIDPAAIGKARLVRTIFGTVDAVDWDVPSSARFMLTRANRYVFGIALPADFSGMLRFLEGQGFTDKSDYLRPVPLESLKKRSNDLKRRGEVLNRYLERLKEERGPALKQLYGAYRTCEDTLKAARMSLFSSNAIFISGWLDIRDKEHLIGILQAICGKRFMISERKAPDAPVRLRNMRLFRPFELLVKTMGMPSNTDIDPTPLTAITFVLMFGLMFGDLGQGLILLLAGVMLKRFVRNKPHGEPAQAGGILIACGGAAAVCGLLYGSVFSSERIVPALWFHPTEHIMRLFFVTILMGVMIIMAGLSAHIVNSFLNGDYTEAFLEKRGLAVLVLYAAIVIFALRYREGVRFPAAWEMSIFIVLPLALFSLKGVLGPALFNSPKPHSISEYVIETVMEIMEIGLGFFANTVSFIRIGAFALSHAGLSIVTYTLAAMADPGMKSAGAVIIIVIGNIFIIGFESLICGIQSMRLEYYEFFSKFFEGEGVVFAPFTLPGKGSEA
ncbi:MAG: V-type ATP synthase subunit I [Syntrophobacteraceae bacterium]